MWEITQQFEATASAKGNVKGKNLSSISGSSEANVREQISTSNTENGTGYMSAVSPS